MYLTQSNLKLKTLILHKAMYYMYVFSSFMYFSLSFSSQALPTCPTHSLCIHCLDQFSQERVTRNGGLLTNLVTKLIQHISIIQL